MVSLQVKEKQTGCTNQTSTREAESLEYYGNKRFITENKPHTNVGIAEEVKVKGFERESLTSSQKALA